MKWTWVRTCILGSIVGEILDGIVSKQLANALHINVFSSPDWIWYSWTAATGLLTVFLFSFAQYGILRHHFANAARWHWLSAAAFFLANYAIILLPSIPFSIPIPYANMVLYSFTKGLVVGLCVSLVQARAMQWSLEQTRVWAVTNVIGFFFQAITFAILQIWLRQLAGSYIDQMMQDLKAIQENKPVTPPAIDWQPWITGLTMLIPFIAWIGHFVATGSSIERIKAMELQPTTVRVEA